jgi:hypothetical protein
MSRVLALILLTVLAALAAASTAMADGKPADVQRVERAVLELDRAKRSLKAEVAARQSAAGRALGRCQSKGKGWKRLKKVRSGTQRRTYRKGARFLWSELHRVAMDRAALEVEHPIFERFLGHFAAPLSDPVLAAGVDAQRHRLAYYDQATPFATCKSFDKLMGSIRTFRGDATGDARVSAVYMKLTTYVSSLEARATRKHWGSRYERALQAARQQLEALGGNGGYAAYFAFAMALRA